MTEHASNPDLPASETRLVPLTEAELHQLGKAPELSESEAIHQCIQYIQTGLQQQSLPKQVQEELALHLVMLQDQQYQDCHKTLQVTALALVNSAASPHNTEDNTVGNLVFAQKTREQIEFTKGAGSHYHRLVAGLKQFLFWFVLVPVLGIGMPFLVRNLFAGSGAFSRIAQEQNALLTDVSEQLEPVRGYITQEEVQRARLTAYSASVNQSIDNLLKQSGGANLSDTQTQTLQKSGAVITTVAQAISPETAITTAQRQTVAQQLQLIRAALAVESPAANPLAYLNQLVATPIAADATPIAFSQQLTNITEEIDRLVAQSVLYQDLRQQQGQYQAIINPEANGELPLDSGAQINRLDQIQSRISTVTAQLTGALPSSQVAETDGSTETALLEPTEVPTSVVSAQTQLLARSLNINLPQIGLVVAFGALGSVVSIIVRSQEIIQRAEAEHKDLRIVGFTRPFVGMAFAIFVFAIVESGVLGNFIQLKGADSVQNTHLYIAIAFLAGFSESLVLGVVARTENTIQPLNASTLHNNKTH